MITPLSVKEFARIAQVTPSTITKRIRTGEIRAGLIGGRYFIHDEEAYNLPLPEGRRLPMTIADAVMTMKPERPLAYCKEPSCKGDH